MRSFYFVAGAGVEPASGAYGAPRKTIPNPPAPMVLHKTIPKPVNYIPPNDDCQKHKLMAEYSVTPMYLPGGRRGSPPTGGGRASVFRPHTKMHGGVAQWQSKRFISAGSQVRFLPSLQKLVRGRISAGSQVRFLPSAQ